MDEVFRQLLTLSVGPLPVIGTLVVVGGMLALWAYKLWEDGSKNGAAVSGLAAVFFLSGAAASYPEAKASCVRLYETDAFAYHSDHCGLIVNCTSVVGCT